MHISEGVFSIGYAASGYAAAAGLTAYSLRKTDAERIPEVAVISAGFFAASLVHIKIGVTSVHLTLLGLTAVLLGPSSPLAILSGLFFQAVLFQHGGISTLGINATVMIIPALLWSTIFGKLITRRKSKPLFIAIAGGIISFLTVFSAALLTGLLLVASNSGFYSFAAFFTLGNTILAALEGLITAAILNRIIKIKPEMIHSCS